MRPLLLTMVFLSLTAPAQADQRNLPLAKRVSMEKVQLAENYQNEIQQCRKDKRKAVRERCQAKRKATLNEQLAALDDNPRAYFHNQARQVKDEPMARQSGKGD